jgi:hypothetical protein
VIHRAVVDLGDLADLIVIAILCLVGGIVEFDPVLAVQ